MFVSEEARLRLLADYGVLDTARDETLDKIVALAAAAFNAPISLISLVDERRQWFKARFGLDVTEMPREQSFCTHVVHEGDAGVFAVEDARRDERFAALPLVVGEPKVVFYAGAPLVVEGGLRLGALCVLDTKPRALTALERQTLETLAEVVVRHLQSHREAVKRANAEREAQHALFMQAPVAIAILEGPDHVFTFANPAYRALVNGRDVVGKSLHEALPDVRDQGFDRLLDGVKASGEPFRANEMRIKLEHHREDECLILSFAYTPKQNASGRIDGVMVSGFDVTDLVNGRERAERAGRQREADLAARAHAELELRRIFELSQDLLSMSAGGFFIRTNPAFQRVLGWTAEELLAHPIADLNHPDDAARAAAYREGLSHGSTVSGLTARYRHKDGSYRWMSWNAVGENGITYAVGRDVTRQRADEEARAALLGEQRQAREAAERAARTMDEFLATVSHELRTPLTAMLGWTRLLRSDQVGEGQKDRALATIERNAVAQAQLIEDLLDVSRIISGKMRLDIVPVELLSVIEAAIDVVRPAADAKAITIHALLDPTASHVTGDSARLQQVVWNLLANAVKYTPRGGRVRVQLVRVASSVQIEVADNGRGIEAGFIDHVFDRFRQADGSISRSHGGLGLGLSIVKNIVELHGGTVAAESAGPGLGATFRVRLPLSLVRPESASRVVAEHPRVSTASSEIHCPPELEGLRVLVVDDENDARDLFAHTLRGCGAVVTGASSVSEALREIDSAPFDVVVSDVGMPEEDGYSFIKRLRALPAVAGGRTPVIALTAYARAEDRTRVLRAGFVNHIAKPVEPSELLAVIASVVNHATSRHD